ncbi:hypothetical protein ADUPG1_004960, partial [Aduncisulcus paluster]
MHLFPAHIEQLLSLYGTFQNIDTDLDERLNGFIVSHASAQSKNNFVLLGCEVQNALRSYTPSNFEVLGPRHEEWKPSKGTWCAVKDQPEGYFFVKLVAFTDLPALRREIMTTTKDVILEKWEGEEDDSYGVEAQGS